MNFKLRDNKYNIKLFHTIHTLLVMAGIVFSTAAFTAAAAQGIDSITDPGKDRLHVSADSSEIDFAQSYAEYIGHVNITRGPTAIAAEYAKFFFNKDGVVGQTRDAESIQKFIATGNVDIRFATGVATSEKAVYDAETDTLELSGGPAKFIGTGDTITAAVIKVTLENGKATFAELMGNATITRGSTLISAAHIKIFFAEDTHTDIPKALDADAIEKFIANGSVSINFESGVATSEKAVYDTDTEDLVLSGNPKVISGKSTFFGPVIKWNRGTGKIKAEGTKETPAEAVIYPDATP